jgi:hypothetical protein
MKPSSTLLSGVNASGIEEGEIESSGHRWQLANPGENAMGR